MGVFALARWIRRAWSWWRGFGTGPHELVVTVCVFVLFASIVLVPERWDGFLAWVWGALGGEKEQLLTLGTVVLAAATYALFRKTADMSNATIAMAKAAVADSIRSDRQHQQTLSGVLGIRDLRVEFEKAEPYNPSEGSWTPKTGPWKQKITFKGTLENVGTGSALATTLVVRLPMINLTTGVQKHVSFVRNIGVVGPGRSAEIGQSDHPAFLEVENIATGVNRKDLANCSVRVEWTTIFNARGWAEYVLLGEGQSYKETVHPPDYVPIP